MQEIYNLTENNQFQSSQLREAAERWQQCYLSKQLKRNNHMCILKVYSDNTSFKPFSEITNIPVFSTYEKGDYRNKSLKLLRTNYRISFDVSEKEWNDLGGQIKDAIYFLEKYFDELKDLLSSEYITSADLDFPIYSRLNENIVNQNDHLPKELIMMAGKLSLGIVISIYSQDAFEGFEN